jgi:PAT family beta-lactamase induction signal transducer AmpG
MAGVMGVGALLTLLMRETSTAHTQRTVHSLRAFLRQSVIAPLADFTTRPHWVAVVCFIVLYKLGDAFLGTMFNPFLLDIGFTKSQIAEIVKLYGFAATMLGVFVGGALVAKLGMYRALMLSGVLHMGTNLLLIVQAQLGADAHFLIFSIASENLTGGMSTAAFIAYLSALCSLHYTATQYALVSSLAAFGRTWLSTPSGYVADAAGWEIFFAISCIISLPSLLVLWWIERRKNTGSHV